MWGTYPRAAPLEHLRGKEPCSSIVSMETSPVCLARERHDACISGIARLFENLRHAPSGVVMLRVIPGDPASSTLPWLMTPCPRHPDSSKERHNSHRSRWLRCEQ